MVSTTLQGGCGNVIFQTANLFAHAFRHGLNYRVPTANVNPHFEGNRYFSFPGIKYTDELLELPVLKETGFTYAPIPKIDNACFQGYYQSWKYFDDCREELLSALGFKWEMKKGTVSIHIRRGDYLKLPLYHPVLSFEYFNRSINYFIEKGYGKFICFSDDMDWVIENINSDVFPDCEFEYSEGRTELEDLEYMSQCEHNIIANSTFSWWGQYLNQNPDKIVIAPQKDKWFGSYLKHDVKDLYMDNWILL